MNNTSSDGLPMPSALNTAEGLVLLDDNQVINVLSYVLPGGEQSDRPDGATVLVAGPSAGGHYYVVKMSDFARVMVH